MTTYRLPDGVEVEAVNLPGPFNTEWVMHPEYGRIAVDVSRLTTVKPPLPPEPQQDGYVGRKGPDIWERRDNPEALGHVPQGAHWYTVGSDEAYTWESVCSMPGEMVELVPDPVAGAPGLPFTVVSGTTRLTTAVDGRVALIEAASGLECITARLNADLAERFFLAGLRAVRETRAASNG